MDGIYYSITNKLLMKNLLGLLFLFLFIVNSSTANSQNNAGASLKIDSLKKVLQTQKVDTTKVKTLNAISKVLLK